MVEWTQLLASYWWVIPIVIAVVYIVIRVNNFFHFFTTLISMVALFYIATIVFFPPNTSLPGSKIAEVLGVSFSPPSASTSSATVDVSESIESVEEDAEPEIVSEDDPVDVESDKEDVSEPEESDQAEGQVLGAQDSKVEKSDKECPDVIENRDDFKKCVNEWKQNFNLSLPGF